MSKLTIIFAVFFIPWFMEFTFTTVEADAGIVQGQYSTAYVKIGEKTTESVGLRGGLTLKVEGLRNLINTAEKRGQKLVLFLNGMQISKNYPEAVFPEKNEIRFQLVRNSENKEVWNRLLSDSLHQWSRPVTASVGLENNYAIPSERTINLTTVRRWGLVGFVTLILCTGWLLWKFGGRTAALRIYGRESSYSLAFVQMAFWFFLVITSYFLIWIITGDYNTVNDSTLLLLGIGTGTALGARIIDGKNNKDIISTQKRLQNELANLRQQNDPQTAQRQNEIVQQLADIDAKLSAYSQGFMRDILHDENGVSLHRLQIVVWTCVLGAVFVVKAYEDLAMPEFSGTLMALMGISSGTYLGFKLPGQQ